MNQTHVPSIAAPAFFRPMSSQKLQAQRSQTNMMNAVLSGTPQQSNHADEVKRGQSPHRYSNASVNTLRDGRLVQDEDVPPLPVSRGTIFTRDGDRADDGYQSNHLTEGNTAESVRSGEPLNVQSRRMPPKIGSIGLPSEESPPSRKHTSQRSFRASLSGLGSLASNRGSGRVSSRLDAANNGGHTKLNSVPSSPIDGLGHEKGLPPLPTPSRHLGRNYEYSATNHIFFLSGRLLNTRAQSPSIATFIIAVLPSALFLGFSAPWLWHHVSPAIPIIFAYVLFVTASSFLQASFSDPGILPRNIHPHPPDPHEDDPLAPGPPTTEWVTVKTFLPVKNSSVEAASPEAAGTAMEVPTKYCKSCNIWRPPRAHHCRVCDACIETQDHHCVWLNNCVGRRNYRHFFNFILFGTLLGVLIIAFTITHVSSYANQHGISFRAALSGRTQERVAFAMFICGVLALPYPGSLLVYHLFLISRGETTREYLNSHKFAPVDRHRPFSQATLRQNLIAVLARPKALSYMQYPAPHRDGDRRYGYDQRKSDRVAENKGKFSLGGKGEKQGRKKNARNGKEDAEKSVEMQQLPPSSSGPSVAGTGNGIGNGPNTGRPFKLRGAVAPVNNTPR